MSPAAPGPTPMARTVRRGQSPGDTNDAGSIPGLTMTRAGTGAAVTIPADGMRRDPRGSPPRPPSPGQGCPPRGRSRG